MDQDYLDKFNKLVETVNDIKGLVIDTKTRVDGLFASVEEVKAENPNLKSKVEHLTNENAALKTSVKNLEQYSRKNDVIINGIPKVENEEVTEIVYKVADALGVQLNEYDICNAHRLYAPEDKTPAIIVKLNSTIKKTNLIVKSKQIKLHGKALGLTPAFPIYINEHLTKETLSLLNKAIDLKKRGLIVSAWTKDGKVFCRTRHESPAVHIREEASLSLVQDLEMEPNPNITTAGTSGESIQNRTRSKMKQQTLFEQTAAKAKNANKNRTGNKQ